MNILRKMIRKLFNKAYMSDQYFMYDCAEGLINDSDFRDAITKKVLEQVGVDTEAFKDTFDLVESMREDKEEIRVFRNELNQLKEEVEGLQMQMHDLENELDSVAMNQLTYYGDRIDGIWGRLDEWFERADEMDKRILLLEESK